ncbi:MAG: hypothetical protein IJ965_05590 [Campylobacter sp.]|nr:hypothetical protein [Campylobacter sp.]
MENSKINKLIVKINSNKLKISDLFTTLQSIENGIKKETYVESEIFIEKVDKGSMIFELVQVVAANTLSFVENINTIASFIDNLNKCKNILVSQNKEESKQLDNKSIEIINGIGSAVSLPNTTINISNVYGNVSFHLDSNEAKIIKNNSLEYLSDKQEEVKGDKMQNTLIYFVQTNTKSAKADKAICEKISKQPVKTLFNNESDKKIILENPYNYNFAVDMEVQYRNEKPALYVILQIRDKWENQN